MYQSVYHIASPGLWINYTYSKEISAFCSEIVNWNSCCGCNTRKGRNISLQHYRVPVWPWKVIHRNQSSKSTVFPLLPHSLPCVTRGSFWVPFTVSSKLQYEKELSTVLWSTNHHSLYSFRHDWPVAQSWRRSHGISEKEQAITIWVTLPQFKD